ncbi:MAG: homocysteine S-methyltransferase family protein, partial [Candidatus Eremiobacteraeota bacterium]|nr:homocysteine S-methyltransferase family protein [Candidatus Eremiobacteraeota bacterium]
MTTRWKDELLLADGAMGTLLFARNAEVATCVELLNVEEPEAVAQAHRDYVEAGAQIIASNTFAANRVKLAPHELKPRLLEINETGIRLARSAAKDQAYVAASVGPLGALLRPLGSVSDAEARDIFCEHIAAVASGQPDLLLLETFGSTRELLLAIAAAQEAAPRLPLLASLSVVEDGKTPGGDPLLDAWQAVADAGADAIGINCAVGPQVVYDALAPIAGALDLPLSVMPNAGYPHQLDDRTIYQSSPAYFKEFAQRFAALGASIIGGCCGTTPEHTRAMAAALTSRVRIHTPVARPSLPAVSPRQRIPEMPAGGAARATAFSQKLGRSFVLTVEV